MTAIYTLIVRTRTASRRLFVGASLRRPCGGKAQQLQNRDKHDEWRGVGGRSRRRPGAFRRAAGQTSEFSGRSDQALFQTLEEDVSRQIDADEDHLAGAGLAFGPLRA